MTERQCRKNKGDAESAICQALIRFEKEYMGRGPLEIRSFIVDDMVLVRLKGVLTQAEIKLAEVEEGPRGRYLLKQVRQELLERGRPLLEVAIRDILGVDVVSVHTDISTRTGERIIVFTLERPPTLESRQSVTIATAGE
ncbi:MAG: DUF2294 domain-containing protein [Planctomycetes bacterium]|nr:DUF2294 domain-containing protein [Planctomycetota bacterium]